jgi:polyisoprenyl-teichoic acid--peptidoglycan teichoic acid transferase
MMQNRLLQLLCAILALFVLNGCATDGSTEMQPIFVGLSGATRTPTSTPTPRFTPTPAATLTPTPVPPPFSFSNTDNLLLLGTDRRPNWTNWRTDSMMVIGIDHMYKRAVVFSIPRDLYVNIPGYGQGRINQVDYIGEHTLKTPGGGPALVSQVISETLGISTKHWVRIEMRGFEQMVDALGGVNVQLDCPFYELIYDLDDQAWTYFQLPAGDVLMDGITAYRFVTLRYVESDFGRSKRQRQFLWALRNQARDTDLILRLPELWNAFQQTFSTDISLLNMIRLARFGLSIEPENVRSAGLTNKELQRYITPAGADVLRIADRSVVNDVIDNVWSGTSLAQTGRADPNACPPPPQGVPSYVLQQVLPGPAVVAEVPDVVDVENAAPAEPTNIVPIQELPTPALDEDVTAGVGDGGGETGEMPPNPGATTP